MATKTNKKKKRGKSRKVVSKKPAPKKIVAKKTAPARRSAPKKKKALKKHRVRGKSESVDELLEEGNAFEAEVVKGVQDVPDADEGEVRTHEVPEDDVPDEYLEKDQ